jgi:RNA polymerase sigma factor (sigma-70 family)
MFNTSCSLLDQLKSPDAHRAWERFYGEYWMVILSYGRKIGLSDADAHDVLQETMVALMGLLPTFAYDPARGKFRNFLLTIVHRKALGIFRRTQKTVPLPEHGRMEPATLPVQPEAEDDVLWRESLLGEALRQLAAAPDLDPQTFAVFRAYVLEHRDCADVAREFGIKPNAVYQIKNRLLGRLRSAVGRLEALVDGETMCG